MNFEDYESLPTTNVVTHMTAGAMAGMMEHCIMYPLDSVKTRMQSLATSGKEGIVETFVRMVKHEGIFRPVKGMSAMLMGAGPSHALYFSSYEYLKNRMIQQTTTSRYHTIIYGISGCMSTLIHDAIMNPCEVVKQRMQMMNSPYRSVSECVKNVYRSEGIGAFYRSYPTQLTMNVPFQSIHFMVYEFAQKITNKDGKYNPPAHMLSGAMAGAIASAITTPLDVCKTLLNTQQIDKTTNLYEAIKTINRVSGPAGYFRGMQARIMYQMPSTAICWSTYEFFKYLLSHSNEVRMMGPTMVLAEPGQDDHQDDNCNRNVDSLTKPPRETGNTNTNNNGEILNLKPRELPSMSGAGIYNSISFNTMHTTDTGYTKNRRKDTLLDIVHS